MAYFSALEKRKCKSIQWSWFLYQGSVNMWWICSRFIELCIRVHSSAILGLQTITSPVLVSVQQDFLGGVSTFSPTALFTYILGPCYSSVHSPSLFSLVLLAILLNMFKWCEQLCFLHHLMYQSMLKFHHSRNFHNIVLLWMNLVLPYIFFLVNIWALLLFFYLFIQITIWV